MSRSFLPSETPSRESFTRAPSSQAQASSARAENLTAFGADVGQENDPSLVDGFQIQYEREVTFLMKTLETEGEPEAIRVKILTLVDRGRLLAVRVEIMCETDLFFYYMSTINEAAFNEMKTKQKLVISFPDFPNILFKMLNSVIKSPQSFLAQFIFLEDGSALLEFLQNMEYKSVELLNVSFVSASSELIRNQIHYRYNLLKSRLNLMQGRLQDVGNIVKVKNPSLLLQLSKSSTPANPRASSRK